MDRLQVVRPYSTYPMSAQLMLKCAVLLLFGLLAMPLLAQVDNVMVYGTVKDMSSSKKLDGVVLVVYKNGAKLVEATTNASGKYEVNLDYGADYKVECSKAGFVGKNITIDTRNVPEEERLGGHGMNIDFTMMVEVQGVDYSVLKEPFGKASYIKASGNFEWDMEYTSRMRDAQARLLKEYEDRKKREASAEAEFVKMMQQGELALTASDFKKAVASFTSALDLKPGDAMATAKLSDARMGLDAQEGGKKLEEQYAAMIKEADQLFTKKEYEASKTKYDAAIDLKDDQPYPKQRIKEIEGILVDLARKAEEERLAKALQEKFQAAITAADASFNTGKWDQATSKYNEALELKPSEKYPKDQLAAIIKKKEEEASKAEQDRLAKELEEKYRSVITAADAAFKSSNWEVATTKYTEAGGLKPEEKYPKDQLAAILKKKEEESRKAEEDRLAKELEDRYKAIVADADASFKSASYDAASASYKEAMALKPAEKYPKDQLAAIENKLAELSKQEEEERKAQELNAQYSALITAADASFAAQQWEEALSKYTEASGLKPAEKYPKDQLAAIRKKQDELSRQAEEERKQRELDERYDAAIKSADDAFQAEDWTAARGKYTEASAIKPTEGYPRSQLDAVMSRMADAEARRKQDELDARYNALVSDADAAFDRSDWAAAKTKYKEASTVKPQESYPKERIAKVDELLADKARQEEEERRQKEVLARYVALIANADAAYDKQQWSAALNDYKDASQLKPEEQHPKDRIAAIQEQMDAAAQARAEEERLARERQELDKRYSDLVAAGDKAFGSKRFDEARQAYRDALDVKPAERHPQERLAEMDRLESEQLSKAEADRLAAERAAEERARKEEEDRLAAELAAAERARLDEEERLRRAAEEDVETRYRDLVTAADRAYVNKDLSDALDGYRDALAVKPDAKHAKDRIALIEAEQERERSALSEAERLAEQKRSAEEERLRQEQEAAEAARLAAERERDRADEERLRRELDEAEARREAEERERMAREGAKAIEERYRSTLLTADEALADKNYDRARGLYAEASDIKPKETYPITKIEQIDQMLAELARQREEAELAARLAEEAREAERQRKSPRNDSRKEQEAEQFMRDARDREEAEKYERIRRFRSDLEAREGELASEAGERRMTGVLEKEQHQVSASRLYEGDEGRRARNAEELDAYREALARSEAELARQAAEERERSYEEKLRIEDRKAQRDKAWDKEQAQRATEMALHTEEVLEAEARRALAGSQRSQRERDAAMGQADRVDQLQQRGGSLAEEQRRVVEEEKRAQQAREAGYTSASAEMRGQAKERLDRTPVDKPRAFADYSRSKLAMDYPPGVTEESYTEGNKVIIRRVVVDGNRADEYSKVIAKWGTFYFKNGQSITEAIWSKETEG